MGVWEADNQVIGFLWSLLPAALRLPLALAMAAAVFAVKGLQKASAANTEELSRITTSGAFAAGRDPSRLVD